LWLKEKGGKNNKKKSLPMKNADVKTVAHYCSWGKKGTQKSCHHTASSARMHGKMFTENREKRRP